MKWSIEILIRSRDWVFLEYTGKFYTILFPIYIFIDRSEEMMWSNSWTEDKYKH